MDLLLILVPLAITGAWIFATRKADEERRRKLGGDVVEIPIFSRGMIALQQILIGLAVVLPTVVVIVGLREGMSAGRILPEALRSLWLLTMVYGIRQGSKILIGERGFAFGRIGIVDREHIHEVKWDRDIGQRQWGVSIIYSRGKREVKHRIYFARDLKPRVESLLGPR